MNPIGMRVYLMAVGMFFASLFARSMMSGSSVHKRLAEENSK